MWKLKTSSRQGHDFYDFHSKLPSILLAIPMCVRVVIVVISSVRPSISPGVIILSVKYKDTATILADGKWLRSGTILSLSRTILVKIKKISLGALYYQRVLM